MLVGCTVLFGASRRARAKEEGRKMNKAIIKIESKFRVSRMRIGMMIAAAQQRSAFDAETDRYRWLTDTWQILIERVAHHQEAGRARQAEVWRVVCRFFAWRYEGKFLAG